jgi:hypothetical protein
MATTRRHPPVLAYLEVVVLLVAGAWVVAVVQLQQVVRWLRSSAVAAATAAELELPWGVTMKYLTQAVEMDG